MADIYIARITGKEVALLGRGNLAVCQKALEPYGHRPVPQGDKAEIVVSAITSRFRGLAFSECTVAVLVEGGIFLVEAFNTSRFFAGIERYCFRTPYSHAQVVLGPRSVSVQEGKTASLVAEQRAEQEPSGTEAFLWEGKIFLPGKSPRHFLARLQGEVTQIPFTKGSDQFEVTPSPKGALSLLKQADFSPLEWRVRPEAHHARSKTLKG